ncbi:MAG: tetratricopeptide repeat protein [Candidatus Eisenbacteria bacterium]
MKKPEQQREARPRDEGLLLPAAPLPTPHRLVLLLVFALIAILALRQVGSEDVGFHLRTGESILAGDGWPRLDRFTFTVNDRPYVDTSWGYDLLLALVNRAGGPAGMVFAHLFLILATFALVYRTARLQPAGPSITVLVLALGALASEMRFQVRPEVLSYFLLSLELYWLHRHATGKRTDLRWLPLLHLAWANLHSLFILGWAAIALFILGLRLRDGRWDRGLLRWGGLALLAALINPYGFQGVLFPFTLATRLKVDNAFGQSIGEFVSPWNLGLSTQFPFYPRVPIFAFRVFALLVLLSIVPLIRRKRVPSILLALVLFVLAARMIRNMPLLVIAASPGLIWAFPIERRLELLGVSVRARRLVVGSILGCLGVAVLATALRVMNDAYYLESRRPERFGLDWNRGALPVGVADYAYRVDLRGHVLNHLNFGGHLMWALGQPVFIDGRLEVIGEQFYSYYLTTLAGPEAMEAAVSKYTMRWLTFPYLFNPKLLGRISRDPRWQLAYVDELGVVFVRSDYPASPDASVSFPPAANVNLAALPGLGGRPRRARIVRWMRGLWTHERFPALEFNLGLFHLYRGELAMAADRFAEGIVESDGDYYEMYNDLGAVLYRLGRVEEARACYRVVLEEEPKNSVARARLTDS